ncbi:MAG: protein-L-isoaspartate(D-aspartate) O-methyltransferase [Planctomycetota bacterium]|jgi:protein-L-isoaspartate(D-aspartate) O-methyltransferase
MVLAVGASKGDLFELLSSNKGKAMSHRDSEPRKYCITPDRAVWGGLLFAFFLAVVVAVLLLLNVFPSDTVRSDETSAAKHHAASAPATSVATAPSTQPATKKWTPPRFTARQNERDAMVSTIRSYSLNDKSVLDAMALVPRHEFVPRKLSRRAYADSPLPIGYAQTISQPYIVAEMTRQLQLRETSRVLEIGTGSGYQAAVLAEFTPHVYTIEIVEPLADSAARRLKRLGYDVIEVRHADGYYGWSEKGPFDGIIVTCAAGQIPPPLIEQLAPGGRMVIPVGARFAVQTLMLVTKDSQGKIRSKALMPVRFVPLTRKDVATR